MKPRHAAALALVGWYLMVPPPMDGNPQTPDLSAPLSKWQRDPALSGTKTQAECENLRRVGEMIVNDPDFDKYGQAVARQTHRPWDVMRARAFADFEQCVSSDRFKEK
jgi:hypothetical protein